MVGNSLLMFWMFSALITVDVCPNAALWSSKYSNKIVQFVLYLVGTCLF
jgi:hypothetical protein